MKIKAEDIHKILGVKESYEVPSAMYKLIFDKEKREKAFDKFLEIEWNVSFDWFHHYFQDEHADRQMKKQDFTPESVAKILSEIVRNEASNGTTMDVAGGTGGLIITKWNDDRMKHTPFDYYPSMYFYKCEELSDLTIPFLLFNLMIRGMNAVVIHGDALERTAKQVYFIQNTFDDYMKYSDLNVMPHSDLVAKEFDIREWLEPAIDHIENKEYPDYVKQVIEDGPTRNEMAK